MGRFKRDSYNESGDMTLPVDIMGITILARVWLQPAEPENGIFNTVLDDFILLNPETEQELSFVLYCRIYDEVKQIVRDALHAKGVACV